MSMDTERWLYRQLPNRLMEMLAKYFRLQVFGQKNIPGRGPVIVAPNHSGALAFDALLLSHVIREHSGRQARVLTHRFWFLSKMTATPANKLGFVEASLRNALRVLHKRQVLVIFPEGEYGNFKPSIKAYDLQEFRTGFVRLALKAQAPIVPTLVIGAEESHINLRQVTLSKTLKGMVLPLPLNIFPLPAKWQIHFLEPISLPYGVEAAEDQDLVEELAEEIREKMQTALNQILAKRGSVYF